MPPPWVKKPAAPVQRRLSEAQEVTMGVQGTVSSPKTKANFAFANGAPQAQPPIDQKIAAAPSSQPQSGQRTQAVQPQVQASQTPVGQRAAVVQPQGGRQAQALQPQAVQQVPNEVAVSSPNTNVNFAYAGGAPQVQPSTGLKIATAPMFQPQRVQQAPSDGKKKFTLQQLRQTDGLIPLQSGTNQFDSQRGMTGFGTPRDVKGKHLKRIWELMYPEEAEQLIGDVVNPSQSQHATHNTQPRLA